MNLAMQNQMRQEFNKYWSTIPIDVRTHIDKMNHYKAFCAGMTATTGLLGVIANDIRNVAIIEIERNLQDDRF